MVVICIMAIMTTLILPYLGSFGQATLRSQARRLAGRVNFLFNEAQGNKLVLRLTLDIDKQGYAVSKLDPYAISLDPKTGEPIFSPETSSAGRPVALPDGVTFRDITVEGVGTVNRGQVSVQFYPQGYVDPTVIHLQDDRHHVLTLAFNPLIGTVSILDGNVMPPGLFQ